MRALDSHHHLFVNPKLGDYLLDDLRADAASVADIEVTKTVFIECHAAYRDVGPAHLRPVGETAWVAGLAADADERAANTGTGPTIGGIVGHADLTLEVGLLDEALDAHLEAGADRFRGIRDALASAKAAGAEGMLIAGTAAPGRAQDPRFRRGVARLGERGLTYESWHYHVQLPDFIDLARACPQTEMILDHLGTPMVVGREDDADEIFTTWSKHIADLATCQNVTVKLGGTALAVPTNGPGWRLGGPPASVEQFIDAHARWYHHVIETFGPDRCMLESNFPVDRLSLTYDTYWRGVAALLARYTADEQSAIFFDTAARVYRIA